MVIFLNGLALFVIELKFNPNGQSVQDGMKLKKRNAKNRLSVSIQVKRHAGSLYDHRDQGQSTIFLPFNKGKGEGIDTGANPHNNPRTGYGLFWKRKS